MNPDSGSIFKEEKRYNYGKVVLNTASAEVIWVSWSAILQYSEKDDNVSRVYCTAVRQSISIAQSLPSVLPIITDSICELYY